MARDRHTIVVVLDLDVVIRVDEDALPVEFVFAFTSPKKTSTTKKSSTSS